MTDRSSNASENTLDRFVRAQASTYDDALAELRRGRKTGHWMWFVFPQIAGLGRSATAVYYAIAHLADARAYLAHSLLGARLVESSGCLLDWADRRSAVAIFGEIDSIKLRSSATLFEAAGGGAVFAALLDRFFADERDPATLARIRGVA